MLAFQHIRNGLLAIGYWLFAVGISAYQRSAVSISAVSNQQSAVSSQQLAVSNHYFLLSTFYFLLFTIFAACTPNDTPIPTLPPPKLEQSAWGDIITVAHAPLSAAPALSVQANGQIMLAWASPDAEKMRLYARHAVTEQPVILVLPAYFPFEVVLFPAQGSDFHLVWIDRTHDTDLLRLLGGRISPDVVAQLGANPLAPDPVYHYSALSMPNQELLIVWSGGLISEPTLYMQNLDAQGRVRFPEILVRDSDYPALAQTPAGTHWLFWILRGKEIVRAPLDEQTLGAVTPVSPLLYAAPTDQLERMTAAVDATHGYLFWQIVQADGTPQVWFTSGSLDSDQNWQRPRLLKIAVDATKTTDSNFNSSAVYAAQESENGQIIQWAVPLNGQHETIAVAVNIGDFLGVLYLREGKIIGYEPVVETGALMGIPALAADNAHNLYLAWSQPGDETTASALRYTTTR